jgi:UDP-N-acetyl-D-glucosamine dehydrogenase
MKALLEKIESKEAVVGIVGMGYVGLPLAIAFAECGFHVIGYDSNATKIACLKNGTSYLNHVPAEEFSTHVQQGKIAPTTEQTDLGPCDIFIVCVPTPLSRNREPDLTCVVEAACVLHPHVRMGRLFVLESTTYPGTTREVFARALLDGRDLVAGKDVFVAHSPERQDPGNGRFKTRNVPKVVGGVTRNCLCVASRLYKKVIETVVEVEDAETAEMVKIFENTYRLVNIAWVNEMKILCQRLGIDVWSVIRAASTKPFGFQSFKPGPGVGGHCIPIDPFYLTWKAHEVGMATRFIELAGEVNCSMPHYVFRRVTDALNDVGKPVSTSSILVLGIAYKADVNDARESPAFEVIRLLWEAGATITYHDPHVPSTFHEAMGMKMESVPLTEFAVRKADAVVVLTDHKDVDYAMVADVAGLVVDSRNVEALRSMKRGRYFQA